jgi:hypothetical protein
VDLEADKGGGVRGETRTGGGSLPAIEFFTFDIFPYYLPVDTLEATIKDTPV